jgi:hypothetical protein
MKILYIILTLSTIYSTTFASIITDFDFNNEIPYQAKGNTEIYQWNHNIKEELILQPKYDVFEEIFIMPVEFYGESELYDISFYVDLCIDDQIMQDPVNLNTYRIRYFVPTDCPVTKDIICPIPEPASLTILILSVFFLRKHN